jgi:hypothetical protein
MPVGDAVRDEIYVGFKLINATRDRINCIGLNLMNDEIKVLAF